MSESPPPTRESDDREELERVVLAFATRVERLRREMKGLREQLEQIVAARDSESVAASGAPR